MVRFCPRMSASAGAPSHSRPPLTVSVADRGRPASGRRSLAGSGRVDRVRGPATDRARNIEPCRGTGLGIRPAGGRKARLHTRSRFSRRSTHRFQCRGERGSSFDWHSSDPRVARPGSNPGGVTLPCNFPRGQVPPDRRAGVNGGVPSTGIRAAFRPYRVQLPNLPRDFPRSWGERMGSFAATRAVSHGSRRDQRIPGNRYRVELPVYASGAIRRPHHPPSAVFPVFHSSGRRCGGSLVVRRRVAPGDTRAVDASDHRWSDSLLSPAGASGSVPSSHTTGRRPKGRRRRVWGRHPRCTPREIPLPSTAPAVFPRPTVGMQLQHVVTQEI